MKQHGKKYRSALEEVQDDAAACRVTVHSRKMMLAGSARDLFAFRYWFSLTTLLPCSSGTDRVTRPGDKFLTYAVDRSAVKLSQYRFSPSLNIAEGGASPRYHLLSA